MTAHSGSPFGPSSPSADGSSPPKCGGALIAKGRAAGAVLAGARCQAAVRVVRQAARRHRKLQRVRPQGPPGLWIVGAGAGSSGHVLRVEVLARGGAEARHDGGHVLCGPLMREVGRR
eukprot:CAMPEP_0175541210 /NCGR_PEP_ID=MMETSP0096-20121207/27139_1 /TAXON_ID=311494 /ORGANISM="Alexandrium monilatum, Strain CCMP3105" /LENGTH=117 /DNA_ID=CAMNT_0016844115 /DNA_START=149 /DNA_END=502 /DNA_ORIENTATION=+